MLKNTFKTTEEFITAVRNQHADTPKYTYDYSKAVFKNSESTIVVACTTHCEAFEYKARTLLSGYGILCTRCPTRTGKLAKNAEERQAIQRQRFIELFPDRTTTDVGEIAPSVDAFNAGAYADFVTNTLYPNMLKLNINNCINELSWINATCLYCTYTFGTSFKKLIQDGIGCERCNTRCLAQQMPVFPNAPFAGYTRYGFLRRSQEWFHAADGTPLYDHTLTNWDADVSTVIQIVCHEHGELFEQTINGFQQSSTKGRAICTKCVGALVNGKYKARDCTNRTLNEQRYTAIYNRIFVEDDADITIDDEEVTCGKKTRYDEYALDMYMEEAARIHGDNLDIDPHDAESMHSFANVKCKRCEYEYVTDIDMLVNYEYGCPGCDWKLQPSMISVRPFSVSKVLDIINDVGSVIIDDITSMNSHSTVTVICGNTGYRREGVQLGNIFRAGFGCPCISCCKRSIYEEVARFILEKLFGMPFLTTNKRLPNNLQLDGYNKKLNLAFEYQGKQHENEDDQFHADRAAEALAKTQRSDHLKKVECERLGIDLIVIPKECTSFAAVRAFIQQHPLVLHRNTRQYSDVQWAQYERLHMRTSNSFLKMGIIKDKAYRRGGMCLSSRYINYYDKLQFKCNVAEHDVFETSMSDLFRDKHDDAAGRWCPACGGTSILADDELVELCTDLGHTFVRSEFRRCGLADKSRRFIDFRCKNGHFTSMLVENMRRAKKIGTSGCQQCRSDAERASKKTQTARPLPKGRMVNIDRSKFM